MDAKIEFPGRSTMTVQIGERVATVRGELYFQGPVQFDADSKSIERWDDGAAVTAEEKAEILKAIRAWRDEDGSKIVVDWEDEGKR